MSFHDPIEKGDNFSRPLIVEVPILGGIRLADVIIIRLLIKWPTMAITVRDIPAIDRRIEPRHGAAGRPGIQKASGAWIISPEVDAIILEKHIVGRATGPYEPVRTVPATHVLHAEMIGVGAVAKRIVIDDPVHRSIAPVPPKENGNVALAEVDECIVINTDLGEGMPKLTNPPDASRASRAAGKGHSGNSHEVRTWTRATMIGQELIPRRRKRTGSLRGADDGQTIARRHVDPRDGIGACRQGDDGLIASAVDGAINLRSGAPCRTAPR